MGSNKLIELLEQTMIVEGFHGDPHNHMMPTETRVSRMAARRIIVDFLHRFGTTGDDGIFKSVFLQRDHRSILLWPSWSMIVIILLMHRLKWLHVEKQFSACSSLWSGWWREGSLHISPGHILFVLLVLMFQYEWKHNLN